PSSNRWCRSRSNRMAPLQVLANTSDSRLQTGLRNTDLIGSRLETQTLGFNKAKRFPLLWRDAVRARLRSPGAAAANTSHGSLHRPAVRPRHAASIQSLRPPPRFALRFLRTHWEITRLRGRVSAMPLEIARARPPGSKARSICLFERPLTLLT